MVLIFGDLNGLVVALSLIFFMLALSSYYMMVTITRKKTRSLVFAAGISLGYSMFDMSSWGGYPNLFSFVFLFLSISFLYKAINRKQRKYAILLGIAAALLFLTHPLSSAIFLAIMSVFLFCTFVSISHWKFKKRMKNLLFYSLPIAAIPSLCFYTALFSRGEALPEWQTSVSATPESYSLKFLYVQVTFIDFLPQIELGLVSMIFLAITIFITSCSVAYLLFRIFRYRTGKNKLRSSSISYILLSICITPFIIALGLFVLDRPGSYGRFSYYVFIAYVLFIIYSLIYLRRELVRWMGWSPSLGRVLPSKRGQRLASYCVIAIVVSSYACYSIYDYQKKVDYYNQFYQTDSDKALTSWLLANTAKDSILLVPPDSYKWVEGLTGRSVISPLSLQWLFRSDEVTHAQDATAILSSRYVVTNGFVQMRVQGTDGVSLFNPSFGVAYYSSFDELWLGMSSISMHYTNINDQKRVLPVSQMSVDGTEWDKSGGVLRIYYREHSSGIGLVEEMMMSPSSSNMHLKLSWSNVPGKIGLITLSFFQGWDTSPGKAEVRSDGFKWLRRSTGQEIFDFGFTPRPADVIGYDVHPNYNLGLINVSYTPSAKSSFSISADVQGTPDHANAQNALEFKDSKQLMKNYHLNYLIWYHFFYPDYIKAEYGFPVVYENEKYVVFKVNL